MKYVDTLMVMIMSLSIKAQTGIDFNKYYVEFEKMIKQMPVDIYAA